VLKADNTVVGIAHGDHVAPGDTTTPALQPQVVHVVQVDVRQQGRDHSPLRGTDPHGRLLPVFHNTSGQPLGDQAQHAPIRNPVLKEAPHPIMVDRVEERPDIRVEHPVHPLPMEPNPQCVQRLMLAASGPEPIGEPEELGLVDGREDGHHRLLDDLVFQGGDAQRPLFAVRFVDVHPPRWQGTVAA